MKNIKRKEILKGSSTRLGCAVAASVCREVCVKKLVRARV